MFLGGDRIEMCTIFDYLKYYKNKKISDVHWNAQDMLLCAILTYTSVESSPGTNRCLSKKRIPKGNGLSGKGGMDTTNNHDGGIWSIFFL